MEQLCRPAKGSLQGCLNVTKTNLHRLSYHAMTWIYALDHRPKLYGTEIRCPMSIKGLLSRSLRLLMSETSGSSSTVKPGLPAGGTEARSIQTRSDDTRPLPAGYRQGVITAITVFIGFSLAFLRFWAFEAPGKWTPYSIAAVVILVLPICGQIYTLYRALLTEDDNEHVYRGTIKWFIWSVVGMLVAVCIAAVVLSGALASEEP